MTPLLPTLYSKHFADTNLLTSHDKPEIWNNFCPRLTEEKRRKLTQLVAGPGLRACSPYASPLQESRRKEGNKRH